MNLTGTWPELVWQLHSCRLLYLRVRAIIGHWWPVLIHLHSSHLSVVVVPATDIDSNSPPPSPEALRGAAWFSAAVYTGTHWYGQLRLRFVEQSVPRSAIDAFTLTYATELALVVGTLIAHLVRHCQPIRDEFRVRDISESSAEVRQLHARTQRVSRLFVNLVFVQSLMFFGLHLYRSRSSTIEDCPLTLEEIAFWLLLFPPFIYMICYYVLGVPFYVVFASRYQVIQQRSVLRSFHSLNRRVAVMNDASTMNIKCNTDNARRRLRFTRLTVRFVRLNHSLLFQCTMARVYGHFWWPYLSLVLCTHLATGTYLANVQMHTHLSLNGGNEWMVRYAPSLVASLIALVDYFVIGQCAALVTGFKRITAAIATYHRAMLCFAHQHRTTIGLLPLGPALVQSETLHHPRLLYPYAFYLFGNYRITKRTFYTISTYVVGFFLYIVKR